MSKHCVLIKKIFEKICGEGVVLPQQSAEIKDAKKNMVVVKKERRRRIDWTFFIFDNFWMHISFYTTGLSNSLFLAKIG